VSEENAWEEAVGEQGEEPGKAKPEPVFADLLAFVEFLFGQRLVTRQVATSGGALAWCPKWYLHAEAVSRLTALWDEFEKAVVGHTLSDWWLHHLDPHLDRLMSRDFGPFMACQPDEHRTIPPLPTGDPDPRLFAGSAFSVPAPEPAAGGAEPPAS
jgi:hypothetical protein